ncbi:YczE/YyaS/YitT family protein [Ferdinandcohnia quinoae]|uniref:YitT family protein n=1 Tax=Fredinandcohnia quinoae TaxID=2918902 RepID=A0AAW5E411_9BACI|nr:YitT family protein [Fredinandcohnia sp. SECRCQ15]MCH1627675.1 YitT family protein [Fredinandcohnia sp. SECRCQ15]
MRAQSSLSHHILKWSIYIVGLLVMSLGIVLIIKANLGASPWDVFHIGLYKQLGLTIGSWSIIVGFFILLISALLTKRLPQIGAFLNMLLVGVFIDMYMMIPFFVTPTTLSGKMIMLLVGIIVNGYGMGLYISSRVGAGPRDSLMIALTEITSWKIQYIRSGIEIIVLIIGWFLGGPVFFGTIIYSLIIGYVAGYALPQCQDFSDRLQKRIAKHETINVNHLSN